MLVVGYSPLLLLLAPNRTGEKTLLSCEGANQGEVEPEGVTRAVHQDDQEVGDVEVDLEHQETPPSCRGVAEGADGLEESVQVDGAADEGAHHEDGQLQVLGERWRVVDAGQAVHFCPIRVRFVHPFECL